MTCPIHTLRRHPSTCRLCPKEDGPGVPPLANQELVRKKLEAMAAKATAKQMDFFEAPEPPPAPPKKVSAEPPKRKRDWYKDWTRVERPQRQRAESKR